jgi:hypothetical protein
MIDTPQHLTQRLVEEGEKTLAFFQSLSPALWNIQVYTEGSCWNVKQVLAHFVSAEDSLAKLIANIQSGGDGTPEDFNLNAYNERKVAALDQASPISLIELFSSQRKQTVDLVSRMAPVDLIQTGRHPFLGMTTLEEIIKLIYRHNGIHIREIRKVISN